MTIKTNKPLRLIKGFHNKMKFIVKFFKKILPFNVFLLLACIWLVFIINVLTPFFDLNNLGIRPRQSFGLIGVVTSVFLHANLAHILANSLGLIICGFILKMSYSSSKIKFIIVVGVFISGLFTWLLSSPAIVIGASGLVFCFIGVLIANAYFKPSLLSWFQALLCLFFYSGALLSLLSIQQGISWAGHFSGLLTGCLLSYLINKKRFDRLFN